MKSYVQVLIGMLVVALMLTGCTLTRGSHLIIGSTRPPTNAEDVRIYTKLPANAQKIAIVSADARNDFASEQNLVNNAVERLKEEAAEVGANGILIKGIGNYQVGSGGIVIIPNTSGYSSTGVVATDSSTGKEVKGVAIYVPGK